MKTDPILTAVDWSTVRRFVSDCWTALGTRIPRPPEHLKLWIELLAALATILILVFGVL